MKERLHQVERSQLNFAAAASHELRTPLHQINAAATLLRTVLQQALNSPAHPSSVLSASGTSHHTNESAPTSPPLMIPSFSHEDKSDAISQLEIIEANGSALGNILENIIDTLDIGRMSGRAEDKLYREQATKIPTSSSLDTSSAPKPQVPTSPGVTTATGGVHLSPILDQAVPAIPAKEPGRKRSTADLSHVLEGIVRENLDMESKARRIAGRPPMEDVEVILEVLPRHRGGWLMSDDPGPLAR
jgi:signal transduction histidine kinase